MENQTPNEIDSEVDDELTESVPEVEETEPVNGIICAIEKRRRSDDNAESDSPNGKRKHKSLKDNPRPICTPALRKQKENQLRENPSKSVPTSTQVHPSIAAQPRIEKEKRKAKELRDKKRASRSNSLENQPNSDDDIIEIETDAVSKDKNTTETLTKLINEKSKNTNSTDTKQVKPQRTIPMQVGSESYNVIEDLKSSKCNITFGQLFDVSPKVRSLVAQGLKFKKIRRK